MKWTNHKLVTGSLIIAITGNLFYAVSMMVGAILPDLAEGQVPEEGTYAYDNWRKGHRKLTHWLPAYLVPALVISGFLYLHYPGLITLGINDRHIISNSINFTTALYHQKEAFAGIIIMGICLGASLHILQDAICGKVPGIMNPKKRFGVRLFRVGSLSEYCAVLLVVIGCIFARFNSF